MGKKNRKRRSVETAVAVDPPAGAQNRSAAGGKARPPLPAGSPGAVGAYIGMGIGVGFLFLGVMGGLRADPLPFPLVLALCVAGAMEAALCWLTIQRSRVAWSFAVALSGTFGLACLFGAPKIRDAMEVSIGIAVLPSVLAVTVTVLLAMSAAEVSSRSS